MQESDFAEVLASVRRFVRERVVPLEPEIEETDAIPAALRADAAEMGLFGFAIPELYGGLGLSMSEEVRLVYELGYTTPSFRSMFGTNNGIAGHVLLEGATEEQKKTWLPKVASGEWTASFALTEAGAGSDPAGLATVARRDGDGWVINGSKRFITNAPLADVFMVFARTDPDAPPGRGISTFMVEKGTPGVSVGPRDHKMGQAGAWTADVYLDDARVPASALIGGEGGVGRGYATAMRCLAHGRIHIAALCVGMCQRLVDESVGYAATREQGGAVIGTYQLVQGLIADSATDLYAARALVTDVAAKFDDGSDRRIGPSCAKYFASEAVGRIADRAVQIHGGSGYIRGVPVERFYRDARLFRIYEGTSQIQQIVIARGLLAQAGAS
ncbi:acyl-CoA dehydrogenase family protein [Frankia sp. CNm7]|uniref:Acyl-CoA dehydrogenase family protein n=1 Tax=Frankia nepalensis TaxID=1836974 RepID=A0A937RJV2_9ACTN|nr:acyl-CoA dehydrogenase family protein [Frankia nepalensis]MBL7501154.1 acyl-CoA dehydrogenase family protein [Frankia nepalensis]MBL7513760.1 acyl-CoA dehydrogenase family protein [Frankia nepalensis]MBL7519802.1 acyl-CoA dehydrogenase family protein [Frankia nepalensis]MBL7631640.1 acyl-CoA dehydrogenase family protein [Frankia nepalensis]